MAAVVVDTHAIVWYLSGDPRLSGAKDMVAVAALPRSANVRMLARMYDRRLKGYCGIGYRASVPLRISSGSTSRRHLSQRLIMLC
jgi:hypothetical protein